MTVAFSSYIVDQIELWSRLHVEKQNTGIERVLDLFRGFANSSENDLLSGSSCPQYSKQFTAGDDVEPSTPFGEPTEDVDIRIRLNGVADQMRDRLECFIEYADMPLKRLLTVDVNVTSNYMSYSS